MKLWKIYIKVAEFVAIANSNNIIKRLILYNTFYTIFYDDTILSIKGVRMKHLTVLASVRE